MHLVQSTPNQMHIEDNVSMISVDKTRVFVLMDHANSAHEELGHREMATHVRPTNVNQECRFKMMVPVIQRSKRNVMQDRSLTSMANAKTARPIPDLQRTEADACLQNVLRTKSF